MKTFVVLNAFVSYIEEKILDDIRAFFGAGVVQYVCVAREVAGAQARSHLHIQIILNRPVDIKCWFLDKCTGILHFNAHDLCFTVVFISYRRAL